jgi:hypothetical protein
VAGFVLDQEAHRQGDQELSGSRFGGVERARTLDGEDNLLDLMREELAISREYSSRQEILAVHPERRVHNAPPRGIFVSNAAIRATAEVQAGRLGGGGHLGGLRSDLRFKSAKRERK